MKKKLTAVGGSHAFVIEKPILELLQVDKNTEFEMTTDGDGLHFRPVRAKSKDEMAEFEEDFHKRYGTMMKNLAK